MDIVLIYLFPYSPLTLYNLTDSAGIHAAQLPALPTSGFTPGAVPHCAPGCPLFHGLPFLVAVEPLLRHYWFILLAFRAARPVCVHAGCRF